MKQKVLNKMKKENAISMEKFIYEYYGLDSDNFNDLSHKELDQLIPGLKRASSDFIKTNKEEILIGNIVLVYDKYNYIIPYYNPKNEIENYSVQIIEMEKCKNKIILTDDDITNFNKYELLTLYKFYKLEKDNKKCRYIKKELMFRFPDKKGARRRKIQNGENKYKLYKRSCNYD